MPSVIQEHAGVEKRNAANAIGVISRPRRRERTTEVVRDKVYAFDTQLPDHPVEEPRVAVDRVVMVRARIGGTEARQVRRHHSGEGRYPGHQRHPVRAGIRVTVNEYHRLAGPAGSAHQDRGGDALDGEPPGFDHERELTKQRRSPVSGSENSRRCAIRRRGAVKSPGSTSMTFG